MVLSRANFKESPPTLNELRDLAHHCLIPTSQVFQVEVDQGFVFHSYKGKTGATICKFVLGAGQADAQLVVLQKQPGHQLNGIVHDAMTHEVMTQSVFQNRYRWQSPGVVITPDILQALLDRI